MNRKKVQGICVVCLHSWCFFVCFGLSIFDGNGVFLWGCLVGGGGGGGGIL